MDDLSGLSWTPASSTSNEPQKPPPMSSNSASSLMFPSVKRNETSGRSTPLSTSSGPSAIPPSKSATPDSFANLVSFGPSNPSKNLSLIEQQKRLQEQKAKKEEENRSRFESQYGGQNNQFWDSLEKGNSRTASPAISAPPLGPTSESADDILAAFDASAPVDKSTHFPIPSPSPSPQVQTGIAANGPSPAPQANDMSFLDDDDPFGLNQLKPKQDPSPQPVQADDDDDFLGLLGKPVSEVPRPQPQPQPQPSSKNPYRHSMREERTPPPKPSRPSNGVDQAVAALVDMGFPADKASQALATTSSGTDVQAAVGLLLTQAHEETRQTSRNRHDNESGRRRERSTGPDRDAPSWMQQERARASRSRNDNRSPAAVDRDAAQSPSAFGNNFLKAANSFWKTSSKKVQQVVNDLNVEHDPNQPKWLRDAAAAQNESPTQAKQKPAGFTDEALLLETGGDPRASRTAARSNDGPSSRASSSDVRQPTPTGKQPAFLRQQAGGDGRDSRSRASKLAVEEQSAQAYVSPARRRRPAAQSPAPEPSVDLFETSAPAPSERLKPSPSPAQSSRSPSPVKPLPVRPKAPPRSIPPVSPDALASTHRHRGTAAEAYKRGDYGAAHEAFTAALSSLPDKHPITIVIRSNRAMTALKVGEPKVAISDSDMILGVIGPSKGEGETIDLANGEPTKPMKDFFGKALMRKAEALEQLERWTDAAKAWKTAVENGYGGSTGIQARNRCEKAAGISKPASKPAPARRPPPAAPKKSAMDDLQGDSGISGFDSAAVKNLRQANKEAEQADEEKFALTENVDARLAAWKSGKQDNLRALLGSLDTVLWPESGWKKISMAELVMPNKVKIQYMKGIAKVHPDKISTDATTEQRMISSAVFGALNEAWDKFRKENNL